MSGKRTLSRRHFMKLVGQGSAGAFFLGIPFHTAQMAALRNRAAEARAFVQSTDSVTLEYWETLETPEELMRQIFDAYTAENPNVTINYVNVPFAQSREKLVTALAGGSGPDLWHSTMVYNAEFAASEFTESLEPFVGDIESEFLESSLLEGRRYQNTLYSLPSMNDVYIQYYRSDLLNEAGLTPPETWDELLEFGLAITDPNRPLYAYPVMGARQNHFQWLSACLAYNGAGVDNGLFDEDGNCILDQPESVAAYEYWGNLLKEHQISPPTSPTDLPPQVAQQFMAGLLALDWTFLGVIGQFNENIGLENYGSTNIVSGPAGRFIPWGVNGYMMNRNSAKKDAVWQLMAYLTSPEVNGLINQNRGTLPSNRNAYDQEWLQAPVLQPAIETLNTPEELMLIPTYLPEWTQFVVEVSINNTQQFLLGQQSAQESLEQIAAFLTEAQQRALNT